MAGIDRDRWRLLEPLLDYALELSAAERESWLAELRVQSPELALDLASLLAGEIVADERGFLARPLGSQLEGLELGAYTLERSIGQGGMGSVWLARRTDGRFEGYAAVKLLNLALLSPSGQARFKREGSVLARLAHPGIARLLDAGVTPGGQPYLVLERIDGQPIDVFARERALSLGERVRLFLQVLGAVGHAHANLIVHRDIKPSNILVTGDGTVKLLDFGIAKLLDSDLPGERTELTVEGAKVLTPEYAAPEQVRGAAITTATDVYSLGVLLYVLVSGRHPTAEGCRSPADTVRALLEVGPARLRVGDLDTILHKALRKEPHERYQTVAELADDLTRYLRHEPVAARGDSIAYRVRKFVRRNRAGVAAAAFTLAALLAATVFSVGQMREAQLQRDAAVYASQRANAQVEFQSLLMSQVGDRPITMREILDRSRNALLRQYAGDPRFRSTILDQLSSRYADLGESTIPGVLLARAESLAVVTEDNDQLIQVRCHIVNNLRMQGRYAEAEHAYQRADSMLGAGTDPRVEAICLQTLADLDNEAGPGGRSIPAIRRAIVIRNRLGETRDMAYARMFATLAYSLHSDGRYREAIPVYRDAIALMDSTGRGETMTRNSFQHDLALALIELGETADAERLLHDVLERGARSDPTGQIPRQALIHYAHTALFDGHPDSAARYFAMLAGQAVRKGNRYWEGRALFGLVQSQTSLGHIGDARRTLARFMEVDDNPDLSHTDDQVVDYRFLEAKFAIASGNAATAHRLVVDMLRSNGYFDGERRKVFRSALILSAETALSLGDPAAALRFAGDARVKATSDSLTETRSAYIGEARLVEARALLASGDTVRARETLGRALVALRNGVGVEHHRTREAAALLAALGSAL